jgi:hypothetical protein
LISILPTNYDSRIDFVMPFQDGRFELVVFILQYYDTPGT